MENKIKELFDKRKQAIQTTCNIQEPEFVPVMTNVLTFPLGYSGLKYEDIIEDPDLIVKSNAKFYDDFYADSTLFFGPAAPIKTLKRLGSKCFFVSEDGYSIQHQQNTEMRADEYGKLIADPMKYLIDEIAKRKFPSLNGTKEEARKALIDANNYTEELFTGYGHGMNYVMENYGIAPIIQWPKIYPTLDVLFDKIRGFQGTLTDIRRRRQEVKDAIEALKPYYKKLCTVPGNGPIPTYPFGHDMFHSPAFLGQKDFEELFFPIWAEFALPIINAGGKIFMGMEGKCERYYDFLRDNIPKGGIICALTDDDVFEAKKKIGDYFAIVGGVTTSSLRYKRKEECIDEAKRVLDECAPGGGFICSTEKALTTLSDVNPENLKAVNDYIHEYGVY